MGPSGAAANLSFLLPSSKKNPNRTLVATTASELEVLSLDLAKFPDQWTEYTAFDVVSLSLGEVQTLAKQQPAAFESLRVGSGPAAWFG